jgi:protein-disulfide isomerase
VAAAVALVIVVAVVQGGGDDGTELTLGGRTITPHTATVDGTTLGDADAPVTIYEYSDFRAPSAQERRKPRQLDTDYLSTGKAKLIFKIMSFIGQESRWAAEAALCAGDQGKFWEYHNKLFEEQRGENKGAFEVANLKRFAGEIGLNQGEFNVCFDEGKYTSRIADEMDEAENRGVNSTPTYFVGQEQVDGTYEAVSAAIDEALATPTPTASPGATGTPTPEGTPGG